MTALLVTVGEVLTKILEWVVSTLESLVANPYFQLAIVMCVATVIIGIILKFFKSFGLKRGSKRRGR